MGEALYEGFMILSSRINCKLAQVVRKPPEELTPEVISSWAETADDLIAEFSDLVTASQEYFNNIDEREDSDACTS